MFQPPTPTCSFAPDYSDLQSWCRVAPGQHRHQILSSGRLLFPCGILSSVSFENAGILSPVLLKGIRSHGRLEGAEPVPSLDPAFHLGCFLLLSLWSGLNSLTTTPPRPLCRRLDLIPLNVREHRRRICHLFCFPSPQPCLDHRRWNGGHRSGTAVADAALCFGDSSVLPPAAPGENFEPSGSAEAGAVSGTFTGGFQDAASL